MKETKEALVAAAALYAKVQELLKDGAQLSDAMTLGQLLLTDGPFKTVIEAGYKGSDKIDDELKAFSVSTAIDLLSAVPELVDIINGKKKVA